MINIDALKQRLEGLKKDFERKTDKDGKRPYLFWYPQEDTSIIRMVPYKFNKENPFVELFFHSRMFESKKVIALSNFGKKDPIVEFAKKLQEDANKTKSKEDWVFGKKLEPAIRIFMPIIVRGLEQEGVKYWGFGKQIYQELLGVISDPDYGDITDIVSGRDITVTFKKPTKKGEYPETTIRMKPKESKLVDDKDLLEKILSEQVEIKTLFAPKTYEELEAALKAWLSTNPTMDAPKSTPTESNGVEKGKVETSNKDKVKAEFKKLFNDDAAPL